MKVVAGNKYLYLRKQWFYFRMRLPKRLGTRKIRFGLQTQNLISAVNRVNQFKPYIQEVKQLVITLKSLDTSEVKPQLIMIKDAMLKQLQVIDIDILIADMEQGYSNGAHALNVLGQSELLSDDNQFKEQLTYIAQATDNETRTKRLQEIIAGLSENDKWPFMDALSSMVKMLVGLTDEVDNAGTHELARQLLSRKGYEANTSSLAFRMLVSKLITSTKVQRELMQSVFEGDALSERETQNLLANVPQQAQPSTPHQEPESATPLFSEVYAEFLEYKVSKEKLSTKMQQDYQRRYAIWCEVMDDKPIGEYKPKDIGRFIDTCFELPKMHISPYNKMTWAERLNCDVPEQDLQAPKSVQQYYKLLQGVFAYAKKDTIGYIENSPCTIKRDFSANVRGIFSDDELRQFIASAKAERTKWKKWITYLAIYTGARRGELAQLRKSDLKQDKETGRYYLLITDEHESQQLKTDNAKRKIPVHRALVEEGFIEHVQSCKERIFDELESATPISGWFPRLRESLGISYQNELGHTRSLHSFRHTFITKLMNVDGMNINLLQQVVGHEISKFGITSNYTHKLDSLKNLLPVVDSFTLD